MNNSVFIDIPDGASATDVDSRPRAEAERLDALGREHR
jgi:hypothetical protein